MLGGWADGSTIILSCPGPLRRHAAALQPAATLALPQVLLGSESQLSAFASHAQAAWPRANLTYAAFPEMFAGAPGLHAALAQAGVDAGSDVVHLRFGGVRAARILKGARNAVVLAEQAGPALLTASHHPFATGLVLPAAMQHVFGLSARVVRPGTVDGRSLPVTTLPDGLAAAGLRAARPERAEAGLELTSLAGFQSADWAAGGAAGSAAWPPGSAAVLLPWNMDHPGSIVPELLMRFAMLGAGAAGMPPVVLLPFNYIGQTGIIRDVIRRVARASGRPGALLDRLYLARVRTIDGVAALTRLSRTAWVDGNDPEHWWTQARLSACGIASVLLDAGESAGLPAPGARHLMADESLWVQAETRCGTLIFPARLPSLRALPALLRMTAEQQAATPADAVPAPARRRRARAAR